MSVALRSIAGVGGALVILWTVSSAVTTIVVPRGMRSHLTATILRAVRFAFRLRARHSKDPSREESVLAVYGPAALLMLPLVWLLLIVGAGTLLDFAFGVSSFRLAFEESGSSLFTLGFVAPRTFPLTAFDFVEAGLGLGLVALLIAYLPSIYGSFSRREAMVTGLEAQGGSPPSGVKLLVRLARIGGLEDTESIWRDWARWFADIEETHITTPTLVFFRSPQPGRSWVTAAGAILDTASLYVAAVDVERQPQAELCIRAGYLALRRIAAYFGLEGNPEPEPADPISISRAEFDQACELLLEAGAPLRDSAEASWRAFAGWRVNYDEVLLNLARLTLAPAAPWTSDRTPPGVEAS